MDQEQIQAQLQTLKQRLEAAASENNSSAELLLIVAELLLLMDQVKNTTSSLSRKRRAIWRIQACQAELDGYHEHYEAIATYTTVPLREAANG
jgi:hypothetical protein